MNLNKLSAVELRNEINVLRKQAGRKPSKRLINAGLNELRIILGFAQKGMF